MAAPREEYVRLRAGRDGGEFVVPAATLVEVSETMKGMLEETSHFRESQCVFDVPASADPTSSASDPLVALRGGGGGSEGGDTPLVVAVDGPAASGKGTLSRRLAERLGFAHLDTGSIYRATALRCLRAGLTPEQSIEGNPPPAAEQAMEITPDDLADPELRQEHVGQCASVVSSCPAVRQALLDFQRGFCEKPPGGKPGAVLDGRDIGTVIWPGAQAKLFVTAGVDTRALRRWKELMDAGRKVILEDVKQQMAERDARDSQRDTAPLAAAGDAVTLDTSDMDHDESFLAAWAAVVERMPQAAEQAQSD